MSELVELCRHVYPAGGRCLGPEEAERHQQPPPSHIKPPFGHAYVPGVLVPRPSVPFVVDTDGTTHTVEFLDECCTQCGNACTDHSVGVWRVLGVDDD